ncbi:lantibiotic ABC transporter permease [Streptococcus gordonii]|uniref:lantibiotic ABC transporter permease n=1 Tax=Streptococcus gordonii TaxID=1302 RepID=UPI001CBE477F|nr:lantibiotic ABC transporter permease [Streptococcus gordonii]MBZ2123901.1 lantibiotic ABC transporter permease [Streptococcus gordonii]WAM21393.1 lantibiotic ABC transporter permease [Streptococcus gordonii]
MFNSIKADYYRIFRSVEFWGVQAFCIFGILLAIFTSQAVSSDNGIFFAIYAVTYNIGMLFIACNVMTSLLLGVDLNDKLYHNNLTTGKTRTQYYFSKALVIGSLLPLQFILLYTFGIVIEFFRTGGNMGTLPANFWGQFAILFVMQVICTYAWYCITSFVLYLTRNYSVVFITYIMTYILLGLPSQMFDANNEWFKAIKMEFFYEDASIPGVITKTAIFALSLITVFTIAGLVTLKKRDL